MVASVKLLHLLEAFSTPWFVFSAPSNHHLVFFLLEIFNNIIQYQFDGNSNLVYTIIRKRQLFHSLANLPSDVSGITKCLNNRKPGAVIIQKSQKKRSPEQAVPQPKLEEKFADLEIENGKNDESPCNTDDDKSEMGEISMEGSQPAKPAEPGTLEVVLLDTPGN